MSGKQTPASSNDIDVGVQILADKIDTLTGALNRASGQFQKHASTIRHDVRMMVWLWVFYYVFGVASFCAVMLAPATLFIPLRQQMEQDVEMINELKKVDGIMEKLKNDMKDFK